jgi:hypothetical protein
MGGTEQKREKRFIEMRIERIRLGTDERTLSAIFVLGHNAALQK